MKLFWSPTSPFVRKVLVLLHETEQLDDITLVAAAGSPIDSDGMPLAANPLGKIPALERPDGPALYDSRVICRYLDARQGSGLYPEGNRLWDVLTLEATADGIMDSAVLMAYEARLRSTDKQYAPWVDGHWAKIDRTLSALNSRWISHLESPLNIGQIAVACALGYLDFRHDDRNWRNGVDGLADWYDRFAARDSMAKTRPPA